MTHQISVDDVKYLAGLSSINLSDEELESLRGDIASILNYIEQLSELNTEGVEPTYQVTGLKNVYRDDVVQDPGVSLDKLVGGAPDSLNNQFKVPKVL